MSSENIIFLVLIGIITLMFGGAALYGHFKMPDKKNEKDKREE
jgi:hypothetical protein